jgi:Carboxypeptidase regulatory-like domain/TonB-dependent Receptor Plug Domain
MFNVSRQGRRQFAHALALAASVLLANSSLLFAQATNTATIRGTVADSSGGVLPGATVNITNAGTKAVVTSVTDDRGGYLVVVFPGVYDLKVELSGFKTYEQKGISISPTDNRGIDVRLEVGQQTETITVTAQQEVIQTETGAREGILTAKQIENLSVVGRSSLELLRILPGVVAPDQNNLESVSFGGGANNTQSYTVNGIRSSNNTVQLDGSSLIDIGSNNGLMVTLNNDMVQEVKVQSSNFAAEYGSSGMSVSGVTKAGSSRYSGSVYYYNRDYHLAAKDRSLSIVNAPKPASKYNYPGGNIGGPIPFGKYNSNKDKLFFFFGLEVQRQDVSQGLRLSKVPTDLQRQGIFNEFNTMSLLGQQLACQGGPGGVRSPNSCMAGGGTPVVLIPTSDPSSNPFNQKPAPGYDVSPFEQPLGRALVNAYPLANGSFQSGQFNRADSFLEFANRLDMKARVDWNVTNNTKAYVRIARETEDIENKRGVWWGASDVTLPSPNIGTNHGRSVSGNVVSVLSPTMTNEALVSWSQLKLDNAYDDPSKMTLAGQGLGNQLNGAFQSGSPSLPGVIPNWGGGIGNLWAAANDMYAHNDELTFSNKLTKIAGAHGLKFGASLQRLQKQQNFNANEEGYFVYAPDWTAYSTGNAVSDMLTGVITQYVQGSKQPKGEFRMWNFDVFAQDSWKIRPNFTLEYGVRGGYWTNNRSLVEGQGAFLDPALYDPAVTVPWLDPGTYSRLNGYCYTSTGCAPDSIMPTRDPFVMPRVNAAWDIDGQGNNVVRGGYGLFFNRNMGNVEYDSFLRIPPEYTQLTDDTWSANGYKNEAGRQVGLSYDTLPQTFSARINNISPRTLTADSWTFPKTHSFSVSYARRIPWSQVLEVAYVGTRGRDLVSLINRNVVPQGALSTGTIGNANVGNDPIARYWLSDGAINSTRPFPAFGRITQYDFEGESNYNSMQLTLSRQTGRRLQYFVSYTLGQNKGTLGDEYRERDPFQPSRTYGIRQEDRRHILNVSWNAFLPDGGRGPMDNAFGHGLLNGWQLSGISTAASGTPIYLRFTGAAGSTDAAQAYYGTPDSILVYENGNFQRGGLAPVFTCDPRLDGRDAGEYYLDINCITFPAFGQEGDPPSKYDIRTPFRTNHDVTLFKNFALKGEQKLQFRIGFFNLFNQAFVTPNFSRNDLILDMNTQCNRVVPLDTVPNGSGGFAGAAGTAGCDPTGGFSFTDDTKKNFGKINLLRGRRIIELALKYYF